jgi:hypothetical protein
VTFNIIFTSVFHKVVGERLEIAGEFVLIHQFVKVEVGNDDIFWVASNVDDLVLLLFIDFKSYQECESVA